MKTRAVLLGLLVSGLIGIAGCNSGAAPAPKKEEPKKTSQVQPNNPGNTATPANSDSLTLVSLSVPNMT